MTVTLAWLSPTNPRHQAYRCAKLWFTPYGNEAADHDLMSALAARRVGAQWQAVRRGTVQHEVFEGGRASVFVDGDTFRVKVHCREDASGLSDPVSFALAVSIETREHLGLPIYAEVRARVPLQVRVDA